MRPTHEVPEAFFAEYAKMSPDLRDAFKRTRDERPAPGREMKVVSMRSTIEEMADTKMFPQTDSETNEAIVREAKASLGKLRELAAELDGRDTSVAEQLREVEASLERNMSYLIEISLVNVNDLTQDEIDWLAEHEMSARVAKGRTKTPLTAADVFGKYGLADPT